MRLWNYVRRALLGEQGTTNEVYLRSQGLAYSGVNGNGGQTVRRSFAATQPATRIIGPTLKLNDPSVTGNPNTTIGQSPLSPDVITQMRMGSLSNL